MTDNSKLFQHEYGIIRKTNLISPRKILKIDRALKDGYRVVFKNTKPRDGEIVLFEGCDFRNPISKRGRLKYKGDIWQYAVIEPID